MKRLIALLGILLALAFTVSACGGLNKDEQKAADALAKNFSKNASGDKPTKTANEAAQCLSEQLVSEAGVDSLTKDKVITAKFAAADTFPTKLSKVSATAYADAYVACYDINKFKADIKKQSGATTAQVADYAKCVDAVKDSQLKKAIIDDYTAKEQTATSKKVHESLTGCYEKLQG